MDRTISPPIVTSLFAALLAITACAPPFSKQLMAQADRTVSFRELRDTPEQYRYSVVALKEIHLWERLESTRFFSGAGISHRI